MLLKSGLYQNLDIDLSQLEIDSNADLQLVDLVESDLKREIVLHEQSNLVYKLVCFNEMNFQVDIDFVAKGGKASIDLLLLSKDGRKVSGDININIKSDNCCANVNIISLIGNGGISHANGNIFIDTHTKGSKGHLKEQSIYLFDKGQSILLPKLFIGTNDVEASHGAKVERLDAAGMFYIMSRGINHDLSKRLMLEGHLNSFFENLERSENYKNQFITYLLG